MSIEECKFHNLLFSLLPVIGANGQLRRGQCLEVTRAPLLKILLGPSDAETSLHVLLLSGKQFILFFIAAVDALVICIHVHVFCVEVKYSCVSARGVEGIVKVVKLDEENFVKTLLSLRNVPPNFLPIIAPVARDFTLAFCNKLLSQILIIFVNFLESLMLIKKRFGQPVQPLGFLGFIRNRRILHTHATHIAR